MKEIFIDELHIYQKKLLEDVDLYIRSHGLRYILWAGTLLGAVREQGFIPWDDDVDIAMPREDYNKLIDMYKNSDISGVSLVCLENNNSTYHLPFAKFFLDNTKVDEINCIDQQYGIFLDVFPIDYLPQTDYKARLIIASCRLCFYFQYLKLCKKHTVTSIRSLINYFAYHFFLKRKDLNYYPNKIEKLAKATQKSKKCAILAHSALCKMHFSEDEIFPARLVRFENIELCIPNLYDVILRRIYGDYTTPPPLDKRIGKHRMRIYIDE